MKGIKRVGLRLMAIALVIMLFPITPLPVFAADDDATVPYLYANCNRYGVGTETVAFDPVFDPATGNYDLNISTDYNWVRFQIGGSSSQTFAATFDGVSTNITLNGDFYSNNLTLTNSTHTFVLTVTAADGTTTKDYTIKINRALSSNADLRSLFASVKQMGTPETVDLDPTFDPSVTNYTINTDSNYDSVKFAPGTYSDQDIQVFFDGVDVTADFTETSTNYYNGKWWELTGTEYIFEVIVTATDSTTKTYRVTIVRTMSSDASLTNIVVEAAKPAQGFEVQSLSPVYDVATSEYEVFISDDYDRLRYSVDARNQQTVSGTINGSDANLALYSILTYRSDVYDLSIGEHPIITQVTAADDIIQQLYQINVYCVPSDNAQLRDFDLVASRSGQETEPQTLTPSFDAATDTYSVTLPSDYVGTQFTLAHYPGQVITAQFNGVDIVLSALSTNNLSCSTQDLTGGGGGGGGDDVFTVTVTSADGSASKTYTFNINRQASANANLSSLTFYGIALGSTNQEIALSPTFDPATGQYSATVSSDYTHFKWIAIKYPDQTVTASLDSAPITLTPNALALSSEQYDFSVADSLVFNIDVLAADGVTTNSYRLTVNQQLSDNAMLSNLGFKAKEPTATLWQEQQLNPSFTPTGDVYVVQVNSDYTQGYWYAQARLGQTVTATVDGTPVTVTQTGDNVSIDNVDLTNLNTTFEIIVTAADGVTKQMYAINATRQASSDASLIELGFMAMVPSGVWEEQMLSPSYDSATDSYQITLSSDYTMGYWYAKTRPDQTLVATVDGSSVNVQLTGIGASVDSVDLAETTTAFTITVTAADGTTTKRYSISVIRKSDAVSDGDNGNNRPSDSADDDNASNTPTPEPTPTPPSSGITWNSRS